MFRRTLCNWFWLSLLMPGVASAGTIYVNNVVGDDRADGLSPDIGALTVGPVATIGRALKLARRGDSISIANTGLPYRESVARDRPELAGTDPFPTAIAGHFYRYRPYRIGTERIGTSPFVIDGHGAVLRGARRLEPDMWTRLSNATYRYQPFRKAYYQLVVNGAVAQEVPIDPAADAPPALEPLQWCAVRGHVYLRVEPGRFIDQYEIEAPLFDIGLGLHNARNVTVRNLNLELFRLDGVHVSGNSRNVRLENVRSTANGRAGLTVTGTSQVQAARLDLAGNRIAERLVQMHGRVIDVPDSEIPPPPGPAAWEPASGRFVRIRLDEVGERPLATASRADSDKRE